MSAAQLGLVLSTQGEPQYPLYAVQDRRISGEWRVVAEFTEPKHAQQVAALLRSAGAAVRIEIALAAVPVH